MAYYDATNGNLEVARCNDAACAGRNEALATRMVKIAWPAILR